MNRLRSLPLLLALAAILAAGGCSINPATGKRQLTLIGESDERQMGRQYDQQLTAQLGLYEAPELQGYVQQLGSQLAAISERPDLDWTFRVVDDPVVNAFALPGGYIYVTRGILAHLDNEAQLAAVLGHEIGHVTARHSVNQMSKAQLAQLGLGVGAIVAPERMQDFGGLVQTGVGLLFLKYSRDDERQADELGLRYLLREDFDPRPMAEVFGVLESVSGGSGAERLPGWLSTHPAPGNRREWAEGAVAELNLDLSDRAVRRDAYLARLDGVVFGEDPRDGFFRDTLFLHPRMELQLRFPDGWQVTNQRAFVAALSPDKDAMVQLALSDKPTAREALAAFFGSQAVSSTGPWRVDIAGLPLAASGFTAQTQQGTLAGSIAFVEYGGRVFQLVGYAPSARWAARRGDVERAIVSFERLRERAALEVQPRRLQIVRPARAMTVEEFASRHGSTVPAETLRMINQLGPEGRFEAGVPYKNVVGQGAP